MNFIMNLKKLNKKLKNLKKKLSLYFQIMDYNQDCLKMVASKESSLDKVISRKIRDLT